MQEKLKFAFLIHLTCRTEKVKEGNNEGMPIKKRKKVTIALTRQLH